MLPVKALLYGELTERSRKVGHPLLRYMDTIKDILTHRGTLNTWRAIVGDQLAWFTTDVCSKIAKDREQINIEKGLNATRGAENENEL